MNIKQTKKFGKLFMATTVESAKTYWPQVAGIVIGTILAEDDDKSLFDKVSLGLGRGVIAAGSIAAVSTVINRKEVMDFVAEEED